MAGHLLLSIDTGRYSGARVGREIWRGRQFGSWTRAGNNIIEAAHSRDNSAAVYALETVAARRAGLFQAQ